MQFFRNLFTKGISFAQDVVNGKFVGLPHHPGMKRDFKTYTKEAYEANVMVYKCIDKLAGTSSTIRMVVHKDGEPVPDHPLQKLLDKPNIVTSNAEFINQLVGFRKIGGEAFIEKVGPDKGPPTELWVWTPDGMEVNENSIYPKIPRRYKWTGSDGKTKQWWVDYDPLSNELVTDMISWKEWNPSDPLRGLSPIAPATWSIDQNNDGAKWNASILRNSGQPSGILTSEKPLTAEQRAEYKKEVKEKYAGSTNAGRVMVLGSGLSWQNVALTPKEMDFIQGHNITQREIALTFGVPGQLVNIKGDQTYANYEQARASFIEDTIIPLYENLLSLLNSWLVPLYEEEGLTITYNVDEITGLEIRRQQKWDSVSNATHISTNEKRVTTGYEPRGDMDDEDNPYNEILIPAGMIPLTFDETDEEAQLSEPSDDDDLDDDDDDIDDDLEE